MDNNSLPNFLLVGAAKSGTTSIYNYLKMHPEVFLPRLKEPYFLTGKKFEYVNKNGGHYGHGNGFVYSFNEYKKLFVGSENYKCIGECSTGYLYFHNESIQNIKTYLNKPKIIIVLRNPIDRAYSNYLHHVRDGYEKLTFEEALANEKNREDWWWGYQFRRAGLYYKQVKDYLDNFECKIILFDDLISDKTKTMYEVFDFLEVEKIDISDDTIYNKSGIVKNNLKGIIFNKIRKNNSYFKKILTKIAPTQLYEKVIEKLYYDNLYKPKIKNKTRLELLEFFKTDIKKLELLINRDLSNWYKK